jgi:hypothetical protein
LTARSSDEATGSGSDEHEGIEIGMGDEKGRSLKILKAGMP